MDIRIHVPFTKIWCRAGERSFGFAQDGFDPRQPVYCSDLGSDLFFGVFLSSRAIRS
jgi:hypothetical protein